MTLFEGLSIFLTFCMIYGFMCFGLGVLYGYRNAEGQCDIDSDTDVCTACGHRDRCSYYGHDK